MSNHLPISVIPTTPHPIVIAPPKRAARIEKLRAELGLEDDYPWPVINIYDGLLIDPAYAAMFKHPGTIVPDAQATTVWRGARITGAYIDEPNGMGHIEMSSE